MSLFHGRDVSLNTYQYVFYSYSDKSPNVLQATYYDNSQNLIYSTDISFGSKTVGDMMLFLENSQTNPYALGKDNITPYFRNIDIPFSGLYKKVLTTSHHQLLMSHVNSNYKETYGNAMNIYEVKANGSSNYIIDDISQPDVLGSFAGIYVFDQSDSSNSGHILKFRYKSTQVAYEENVTYAGTPGTLNSFTIIEMDYSTPILEYYCEYHSVAMFGEFKILPRYSVKVVTNIVGDSVYALSFPYSSVYYNQPDISFGAGDYYIFDVSDPTMANYNLVFGTNADDATTINNDVVSETNGFIILDISSGYSGSPLVLFDLSNANMGYVSKPESDSLNTTDLVFHIDASQYNYSDNSQINMTDVSINDISPLGHTLNSVNGDATNGLIYFSDDGSRKSLYFPNPGNSGTSETLIYNVAGGTFPDDVFTTFMVNDTQSIYPVSFSRTNSSGPFHSNGEYLNVRNYNDYNSLGSWVTFDVSTNISSSINLQTIVLTPNLLEYDMLGINGETFNDSLSGDFVGSVADTDYDDDSCHNYYIGSIRNNDQPFQGHIYEFLAYKNAYMSDSTIASIQNYLSKKWFTQSLVDNVTSYIVTVSNEVFYIDNVEKLEIAFESSNTYVFDQSDATNAGQQIVFGYTFDSSNVFVSTDGVQVVGTPGQPGAYTSFTVPSNPSGTIHYYSDGSSNMGYLLVIEASYVFSVKNNVFDEPVWALYDDTEAVWYNQPDLSFSAPYVYEFDVSDTSNNGYALSFGTTVDVYDASIESSYVTRTKPPGTTDAKVLLDLRDYSGDSMVYFEDTSAGMGYSTNSWIQKGGDLDGEAEKDQFGKSVSLSSDGNVLAVGGLNNDGNGSNSGHARVFAWNSSTDAWEQRGNDIDGEAAGDQLFAVSLSSDGTILAVGANGNDGGGNSAGHVRVFVWDGINTWTQLGDDIDDVASSNSGYSTSISSDGTILAIGAIRYDAPNYSNSGSVRIVQWDGNNNTWSQRGSHITDSQESAQGGTAVSLSSDGNVVACGSQRYETANGVNSGRVRVFEWDSSSSDWTQRGDDLDGDNAGDFYGTSVSLSSNGNILAIGGMNNDTGATDGGHSRVFEWDGGSWTQLGNDFYATENSAYNGYSTSLSSTGNIVAIGTYRSNGLTGHVNVYKWDGTTWIQIGDDIVGEASGDHSASFVSLSSSGNTLAIGAILNDGDSGVSNDNRGHTRVYKFS